MNTKVNIKEDNACTMRARYHNAQANHEMQRHKTVQMLCHFLCFIMDEDEPELSLNYSKRRILYLRVLAA